MGFVFKIAALLAVLAVSSEKGRELIRKALKSGVRAGYIAKKNVVELADKASEYKEELMAEIKEERQDAAQEHKSKKHRKAHASADE